MDHDDSDNIPYDLDYEDGPGQRVALLLRTGGPATPDSLLERLEELGISAPPVEQKRRRRLPAPHWSSLWRPRITGWTGGMAFAAAALVAAVVLVATGGSGSQIAATRVADVWQLPATTTDVAAQQGAPADLAVSFHGTVFPNYRDSEGWHALGTRSDTIDGHRTLTVVYGTGPTRRSSYTVIAGNVSVPANARRFTSNGTQMAEFRDGNRWVIVFRDHGNSCVLAAAAPRERAWLIKLAAWKRPTLTT